MSTSETTWPWERLNQGNVGAHGVLTTLLEPRAGERWLDVGTGGGGLAIQLARSGAEVVGVDIAEDGLEHARTAAAEAGVAATFLYGDAQELPFEDASFDGIGSAFGVIFAADDERAAAELGRVCKPGGKLGLTLMPLDSRTGELFTLLRRYGLRLPHPGRWSEQAEALLSDEFELQVERRESAERAPVRSWEESLQTFAPLRAIASRLDDGEAATLRTEFEAVEERFRDVMPTYVVALGKRR